MLELLIPFLVLFACLAIGVPVAFSMGISGVVGLVMSIGMPAMLSIVGTTPYRTSTSFLLTTVPTFILMAEFLSGGRIATWMYEAMYLWFGRVRGGLAIATTVACGGMGAMTGSSTATVATFGTVGVPHMRRFGYSDKLSLASIAAAGTLASIIPPSVALIIYGITTETPISALFSAGVVPGVLTVGVYSLTIWLWVKKNPAIAPGRPDKAAMMVKLKALGKVWPAILLILLVLGGIYSGITTPTEAGALGAVGALILSVAFGGLRWKQFSRACAGTAYATAMIMTIVMFATIFGYFLAATQAAPKMLDAVRSAGLPTAVVMGIIVLLYLVLGTFMDQIAILVITLPVTFPLVTELGFNAIWFGILVIKLGEIGLISPPVGLNVFVIVGSVPNARLADAFRGVWPFVMAELLMIGVLFLFPELATWLPGILGEK